MAEDEIDLRECLLVVIKRWKLSVGITVLFAIVAVVYSLLKPNVYQSTAVIGTAKIQKSSIETVASTLVLLKNPRNPYLVKLADELGLEKESLNNLLESFEIEEKADYFLISGRGNTPEKARKLVAEIVSIILERQNNIIKDALKITGNEMEDLKAQITRITAEIANLDKKILLKEKTSNLAQSYVFQGLIESKESALKRQTELTEKLRQKEMEIGYFTKPASIIAEATLPEKKIAPHRAKIVAIAILVGTIFSLFIIFVLEYFEKKPLIEGR